MSPEKYVGHRRETFFFLPKNIPHLLHTTYCTFCILCDFSLHFAGISVSWAGPRKESRLRCYQCNIGSFPPCFDPFSLETGKLANCSENRPDGRREMCAKIRGTIVDKRPNTTKIDGSAGTAVISVSTDGTSVQDPSKDDVTNASSATSVPTRMTTRSDISKLGSWNSSMYSVGDSFFARACFPIGDGWVHRNEPYNETFIFGDFTIRGSVHVCRNTRCNSATRLLTHSIPYALTMQSLLATFILMQSLWIH